MPRDKRMEVVAAQGMRAYSFWTASDAEQEAMLKVQARTGLKCASIVGSGKVGRGTGLTRPGFEKDYLDAIEENSRISKRFGGPDLIIFVGEVQKDIPASVQYKGIVEGLKKAGDIAAKYGCYLTLEALNRVESPNMSVLTARENFQIIEEVAHPHVRTDFDMYHLQLSEGNITNNLKLGLQKGWIRLVQIGEVPGRREPGTGETDYAHIFRVLRAAGYSGYVDMEHGTSSTPERAIDVVRKLSVEN
jgi:hydroxypyruvate isomerase